MITTGGGGGGGGTPSKRVDGGFRAGAILRVHMHDFMTYTDAEVVPGPRLNVIVGPNGTGKSSVVCAIALALGGKPAVLGRANKLSAYIRRGQQSAWVEIELARDGRRPLTIRRDIVGETSSYTMDRKRATEAEVQRAVAELQIQVDNLCMFLPQDRVKDFFKKTPIEVLKETERSVGSEAMLQKHSQLEEWQKSRKNLRREREAKQTSLEALNAQNADMERAVQRYQQRNALLQRAQLLEKKVMWQKWADRNQERQAAKRAVDEHKQRVEQLRVEIAPRTVKLRETEAEARQCKEDIVRVKREQRDQDTQRLKFQDELAKLLESHDTLQDEIDGEAEEKERAQREIEKARTDVRKLEQKIAELPDLGRAKTELQELEQPLRAAIGTVKRCGEQSKETERKRDDADRKHRHAMESFQKIENDRNIREQKLNQSNRALWDLVRWMRNTTDFNGRYWEPLCLDLAPRNSVAAAMLEKVIPKTTLHCIGVENDDDQMRIRKKAKDLGVQPTSFMLYTVDRVLESVEELNRMYPPPDARFDFATYGVTGWLADAFEAPIMTRLLLYSNARHVLMTLYHDKGECPALPQLQLAIQRGELDCAGCIDSRTATQFKRSKYGDKSVTSTSEPYKADPRFLVPGADESQREARRREMEQCEDALRELERKLEEIRGEEKAAQQETTRLRQRQRELQDLEKTKKQLQDAIGKKQQTIRDKESVDYEKKLRQIQKRQGDVRRDAQTKMAQMMAPIRAVLEKSLELDGMVVRLAGLEELRDQLEAQLSSESQAVKDAEKTLQELKAREESAKRAEAAAKETAKQRAPMNDELKEQFAGLPPTVQELEQEIMNAEQQAQAIFAVPEEEIRRFEERKREAARLQEQVSLNDEDIAELSNKITKLRIKWLEGDKEAGVTKGDKMGLRKLVQLISTHFSDYVKELGCEGAVDLHPGDDDDGEDFANYAIHIKASFRPGKAMKTISSEVHSGGERSLSTMIYLIALQPLTPAPFRLVDEINQALDPNNERRIWEQVVRAASKEDTPQYFLVTPKLLPDLTYTDDMVVMVVFNGPANLNQEEWKSSLNRMISGNDDDF